MRSDEALVEKVRTIWTPEREVAVYSADLSPGTEIDSIIRHAFHHLLQFRLQEVSINLDQLNTGSIQFNISDTELGRVASFWHHKEEEA